MLLLEPSQDVLGQRGDILRAVAQRQDDNPGDVEAVEQVFAKPTRGDFSRQVPVRGRDDASVGAECFGTPDALELALLKDAEDLGLGRERQLCDFIEEEGPTGGTLEAPGLLAVGSGEGALLMTEQLAFDQALWQRPTVDTDQGAGRAR